MTFPGEILRKKYINKPDYLVHSQTLKDFLLAPVHQKVNFVKHCRNVNELYP